MRNTGETTRYVGRRIGEDKAPIAPEPPRAAENEEWAWMVDEDPAFYLAKPGSLESA